MRNSRIYGFRRVYSKEFLEKLAKDLGIEWVYPDCKLIPKDEVSVNPMPPPSGILYYREFKYNKDD